MTLEFFFSLPNLRAICNGKGGRRIGCLQWDPIARPANFVPKAKLGGVGAANNNSLEATGKLRILLPKMYYREAEIVSDGKCPAPQLEAVSRQIAKGGE
jgi:hypothetical protein